MASIKGILRRIKAFLRGKKQFKVNDECFWSEDSFIKLGTDYGGWLIPKNLILTEQDICYLVGAGEDISFDCELASRFPCEVYIFDPTPRAQQHFEGLTRAITEQKDFAINNTTEHYKISATDFQRIHFYPWGLAGQDTQLKFFMPANVAHVSCSIMNLQKTTDYFIADCFKASTIYKKLNQVKPTLIKLDIEGAEYQVIDDLVNSDLLPKVLLVEFDEIHTPIDSQAFFRVSQSINLLKENGMQHIFMQGSNATFIKGAL